MTSINFSQVSLVRISNRCVIVMYNSNKYWMSVAGYNAVLGNPELPLFVVDGVQGKPGKLLVPQF